MPSITNQQPGLKNTDPAALVQASPVSIQDVHIGIEHGPSGTTYNRMALPWSGADYERVNGGWRKVAGRDNALSGEAMERAYPQIVQRWEQFASEQQALAGSSPGTFDQLVEELRRAH